MRLIRLVMERLELTLHPTKTKLINMGKGKEGFDFLGMHHRRIKEQNRTGYSYVKVQQWLTSKAEQRIRDVIRARLATSRALVQSVKEHIEYLNPKIRGWKTYYGGTGSYTNTKKLVKLDWYIIEQFARWYAKKRKKNGMHSVIKTITRVVAQMGLLRMTNNRMHMNDERRKAV